VRAGRHHAGLPLSLQGLDGRLPAALGGADARVRVRRFYDDYQTLRAFLHSHSYTGNPLACRAALATLDIFAADDVVAANRALARVMAEARRPWRTTRTSARCARPG